METGKPRLVSAPVHISSVAAQTEKRMDVQAPLRAVYIHTVPALPAQPYPPQPPAAVREPATLHLAMPSLYSSETLPFLTLHIAGGLQSQPGLSVAAGAAASRPKSAGKHVCPHCGRDCMKPSVLEKHLRCHTGERPYPCATCGVSFKTQSNLYKHKRTQAHARLSSESEQSSLGSLDSMSSSRETCTSSLSLDEHADELESMEKDDTLPAGACPARTTKAQGSVSEQNELAPAGQKTEPNGRAKVGVEEEKQTAEGEKAPLIVSRHLHLQRQEATRFSKRWESSVSSGKSQSHESTDSGFGESNDHYPSPASILPDHSMDSLAESTKEHLEEISGANTPSALGPGGQELRDTARNQEQKTLEERISKLISENTAVVEDKQLDNVRPRKTVLSKQGSIDLPMPYTYKDSFHFDMKICKTPKVGLQRSRAPGLYSSVPTQRSPSADHAPLTRSNSLPFSVTLLQPEKSSPNSSYHSDYVTLVRRGSSGQITPTSFAMKPVNQQSSTHHPLVRQTAVDCNHATDGHFINSSVEEACTGSLSCDGDGGEICAEPSGRKFRRKKAQKFAYNKWYMYGGGTFKKLYNAEKGGDNIAIKGRKCLNPDNEVMQSPHKRVAAVHKDMATASLTADMTGSSVPACHPGCSAPTPPFASGTNVDPKASQHSSNSPLKAQLRRNLSLSVLPLSSFVSLKTSNVSGTDTERIIHDGSTWQPYGAHVPSDRKKQKTDDKVAFPLTMETALSAVTHPLPSVTGSVPQQEAHLSPVNFPENQKHSQVKEAVFLPRIINANVLCVSTSPATSVYSAAKTSFLPKYQLKLPNVTETDSMHLVDKASGSDIPAFTSAPPSSHTEQNSPLGTTSGTGCKESIFSLPIQTCDVNPKVSSSTRTQFVPPCKTTLCRAKTSPFCENGTSSQPGAHRQFAATTITTACLKNDQAGICSALIQPSKCATSSAPIRFPTRAAPVVANISGRPTITATNNQKSAADITGHPTSNRPLTHSQPAPEVSPVNRAYAGHNTPVGPCHVIPFSQEQPVSQNVFHVHTADLQICLQIISDEQLALIEPQIEREAASSQSQGSGTEALAPDVIRNKAPNCEISSEGGQQREAIQSVNADSVKCPLSVHFGKGQPNVHSDSNQATISSPETLGLTLRPHKHSKVSVVTETLSSGGDVMPTATSLIGVHSGKRDEERDISRTYSAGAVSQTLPGQPDLSTTCSSPAAVSQNSTRSDVLVKEGRDKPQVPMKASSEAHAWLGSRVTYSPEQGVVSQASGAACASDFAYSVNKCSQPLNAQISTYDSNPPADVNLCKQGNRGCDRVGPADNPAHLQETAPGKAKDLINLAQAEQQPGQITAMASKTQVEKPRDMPAALPSFQSSTAGVMEAASPVACAGQRKPQDPGHGGSPGRPGSTDCRLRLSRDPGETNQRCAEGQGGESVTGEDKDTGLRTDQGEDLKVKEESFKNSWLSEQHLPQTHSGMSDYPPQSPQQAPSTSHNLSLPSRGSQTSIFDLPQPPLETNNFCFSQQQQWESGITQNHQTHIPRPPKAGSHIKAQFTEPQNAVSPIETLSQQQQKQEHQQTVSTRQANSIQGNSGSCRTATITLGSCSPGVKTCTNHFQVSHPVEVIKGTADWTENTQTPNNNNNVDPGMPSKAFTYPEPEQDTRAWPPNDHTTHASDSGSNKYQTFFLTGQFHSFQPGECLNIGVRAVPNCQDYSEDTSSSDEEGKLIIEL